MTSPTISQVLECISENPGIATLDIARKFEIEGTPAFDRTYHNIRVKLSTLADRGEIYRKDKHLPGHAALWYPGGI